VDEPLGFRQLRLRAEVTDFDMGEELGQSVDDFLQENKDDTEKYVY